LERDQPWYAQNRDLPEPPYGCTRLYSSLEELREKYRREVRDADLVIVGSYVTNGIEVGEWVCATATGITAFYDIDTPVTLAGLERGDVAYLSKALVRRYDLYLSFTGGPTLRLLEKKYGAPRARVLYCSVDPERYYPEPEVCQWDIGYLGTYSSDRQPTLERLLVEPARRLTDARFAVAGPLYPSEIEWPGNIERIEHLAPAEHSEFYNSQRFTLNVTRADMIAAGYSPSVRLFEAGACGTAIISDYWDGLSSLFKPGREILIVDSTDDVLKSLRDISNDQAAEIGTRLRQRILREHTCEVRAHELERYAYEAVNERGSKDVSLARTRA
jgi:spore maturation protein CgeB